MEELLRCLKSGGQIRIATDHGEYFEVMQEVIAAFGDKLEEIDFAPAAGAGPEEIMGTNYERKYIKDKREIYTIAVRKV
jgi:tRNA G46 methylase TrmB